MKKTNVLFQWVGTLKRAAMVSAFAVFALFLVGMQGVSAQNLTHQQARNAKNPKPIFVAPNDAIQSLEDGIALVEDHIENNPNMTGADIENGRSLQVTFQQMIDKINDGDSVEDAFTSEMHAFQVSNRSRTPDEQRKLMRVRKETHKELTL